MFASYKDETFVLLSVFVKKTNKTPLKEINKAQNIYEDLKRRGVK